MAIFVSVPTIESSGILAHMPRLQIANRQQLVTLTMKRRKPSLGYQRIAQQLSLLLDVGIDKEVTRRVLAKHYQRDSGDHVRSWLTFFCHTKDSQWSLDFFRCESLILMTVSP